MATKTLRVRASGTALVQNYERLELGVNSFIGRRLKETEPGKAAWVPTEEVVEVPYRVEYVKALKAGSLEAADDATARLAGVEREGAER